MTNQTRLTTFIKEHGNDIYKNIFPDASIDEVEKAIVRNRMVRPFDTEFKEFIMLNKEELVQNYFRNISTKNTDLNITKPRLSKSLVTQINQTDWRKMNYLVSQNKNFSYFLPKTNTLISYKNGVLKVENEFHLEQKEKTHYSIKI